MKNITMEDAASEWVRIDAAKRNTSVSRPVGEMIAEKMRHDDAYGRAMREALRFEPIAFENAYLKRDEYMPSDSSVFVIPMSCFTRRIQDKPANSVTRRCG